MDKWQPVYNEFVRKIEKCFTNFATEKEQVQSAFEIAIKYWEGVKMTLPAHTFKDSVAEKHFYKYIKPRFTCYIEYLSKVYLGLCYEPEKRPEVQQLFWTNESKKLQKFTDKNSDFVAYYKSGNVEHDAQYFLPENYDLGNFTVSKIYDMDGEFMTSHDHLVAELLAQEMYHDYVDKKIEASILKL